MKGWPLGTGWGQVGHLSRWSFSLGFFLVYDLFWVLLLFAGESLFICKCVFDFRLARHGQPATSLVSHSHHGHAAGHAGGP